jgi:hypothetical protein
VRFRDLCGLKPQKRLGEMARVPDRFSAAGFDSGVSVEAGQPLNVRNSIGSEAHAVARSASRLFAASLFLALFLAGIVRAAEEADRSALEDYAIWANRSLQSLPEGVQAVGAVGTAAGRTDFSAPARGGWRPCAA